MTITEFLEARIAEDEATAMRVANGSGEPGGDGLWSVAIGVSGNSAKFAHVAANPTRILAECAAKRAIIAEHVPVDYSGLGMESPNACARCGADLNMSDWDWVHDSFPCPTLRALAAVYADHPDYQQEWK